ncbi:MAG: 30S ribosome-binding factor RbfA [Spirochaetota bacterium]
MSDVRLKKIESLLQQELSTYIITKKVKDPRVNPLFSVSSVKVSKDLHYAKVYISGFAEKTRLQESVEALNKAAGYIQGLLGKKLKTRNTPKLTFIADLSIQAGFDINKKIEELGI